MRGAREVLKNYFGEDEAGYREVSTWIESRSFSFEFELAYCKELAKSNKTVGKCTIDGGLTGSSLIEAVRQTTVRFSTLYAATYHIYKHPLTGKSAEDSFSGYLDTVQKCIRGGKAETSLSQEGSARVVKFSSESGEAIVFVSENPPLNSGDPTSDSRVFLLTFNQRKKWKMP